MSDHSKITSLIQSLLSGSSMSSNQRKKTSSNSSIPPYVSSSIYNKKNKKKTPKRFTFDLAFYNNLGDIMKGNTIDEKKMVQTGNGNILLYEHNNAEDVKTELLKLLSTITETNDLENLLIYLKREGRKKQFRKHFCSSPFVYDATGLKDITGRDSKSLHIVISKFIDFNNFNELTLHTSATINTTNVNGSSDSNSNISVESPFKISFPTNESRSRKSKKIQQSQRAVTITEISWINNINNVSPREILTIYNHFYFLQFV